MGSALPDPVKDQAAIAPVPQQAIENKPAPGQTGPKGMSPRTTYSRVNTGSPPAMDAGGMSQKSGPNRGMEFLPSKLAAHRGFMTTMKERPLLQELVKAAMHGTSQRLSVNLEAAQAAQPQARTKTASASTRQSALTGHVSTEMVAKLASALEFMEQQLLKEADLMPGEGPGALQVLEATSSEKNIDAGESGQATSQNQPPQSPPLQPEKVQQGNAGTGLQTNDEMQHPEQPTEPIKNAMALVQQNLERLAKVGFAITDKGHEFDAKLYDMKARHAAERMALGEEFGAHRFGGGHEIPEEQQGVGNRLLSIARFGSSEAAEGDPRHLEYAAKAHSEGRNAWNPLGGALTPSSHESGGTPGLGGVIGQYHKPGAAPPAKTASAMGHLMGARDAVKALPGKAKAVASEAKDIFSGSRARESFGKYRNAKNQLGVAEKGRAPGKITDAIKGDVTEHRGKALREGAKTVGAYGGVAAAGGGAAAAAGGKKKESAVPLRLIRKLAEDAINPAQISAGTVNPAEPPEGATPSEEGVPSEPSDVTSQKSMISSNQAAINYTKQQAKADPKKDVAQVLNEPPLSSSTDKVLERAFDATGQAGVKISSAKNMLKTAHQASAARILLERYVKTANADCAPGMEGKAKKSMGLVPTTPQEATGASAATMGQ